MAKLTPAACRAARSLLRWTLRDLGREAGVAFETVHRFENEVTEIRASTAEKLVAAFDRGGVEITNGTHTGARLRLDTGDDDGER